MTKANKLVFVIDKLVIVINKNVNVHKHEFLK